MSDENLFGEVEEVEQIGVQLLSKLNNLQSTQQSIGLSLVALGTEVELQRKELRESVKSLHCKLDKILGIIQPPPASSIKVVIDPPVSQ